MIKAIVGGIKWIGFKEWVRCCWYWRKLATEGDIDNWKRGN